MLLISIWMCEDRINPDESGFGRTKEEAEAYVSGNRGYDYYTGSDFDECAADGWAKPAVKIKVPRAVVAVLLKACEV